MTLLTKLIKSLRKITLIDRCLILFMVILMFQLIYNLFSNEITSEGASSIDVVIRTTSAAVFGYFLSANFIKKTVDKNTPSKEIENSTPEIKNISIDFTTKDIKNYKTESLFQHETSNQQIIIATIIGVTSLIVIIIARNCTPLNENSLATLTQLRDFVSGCVGFLLGSPTKKNK